MGYAHYEIYRNGQKIEAGYAVEAECEQPDCTEQIDRGLDYLCGQMPGGHEFGCGGYFCGQHLYMAPDGERGYLCGSCMPEMNEDGRRLVTV